ncbi:LysE family transporter [Pleomorphomonas sp. T1.2MG-36]|uniref:LysE family transporter n=1 Tax=Pleomorphomonas sp. T1.2MG-36 TaxID=3041167 RepID=UPI002540E4DD|nr:LysE family transporter [Pleomorphomonas sp. T1.2MG-36]
MSPYLGELAGVMAVFSFAIVAPGADTAMVMRQSLVHGRRAGILTAFGVGTSLLFHLTYTILGLGLIVSQSLLLFSVIKWAGAAYLAYMGIMALRAPAPTLPEPGTRLAVPTSNLRAFGLGFLTNALNPKPILFFLSLFSALVSHQTPALVKGGYGLVMAACLILWFSAVSCFLTMPRVRNAFSRAGLWINRVTGAVFIAFSIRLALSRAE